MLPTERRYVAQCRNCGTERSVTRGVVLTGKIPVCDGEGCGQYMDVYAIDPRPPAPRHPVSPLLEGIRPDESLRDTVFDRNLG